MASVSAYRSSPSALMRAGTAPTAIAAPLARYLTNDEAGAYLRLSPRTLEKMRVIGGGPRFRKFGRRVMYAIADLDVWADGQAYDMTSDPDYLDRHAHR